MAKNPVGRPKKAIAEKIKQQKKYVDSVAALDDALKELEKRNEKVAIKKPIIKQKIQAGETGNPTAPQFWANQFLFAIVDLTLDEKRKTVEIALEAMDYEVEADKKLRPTYQAETLSSDKIVTEFQLSYIDEQGKMLSAMIESYSHFAKETFTDINTRRDELSKSFDNVVSKLKLLC